MSTQDQTVKVQSETQTLKSLHAKRDAIASYQTLWYLRLPKLAVTPDASKPFSHTSKSQTPTKTSGK